jgi:pilus assembly protein CpaE
MTGVPIRTLVVHANSVPPSTVELALGSEDAVTFMGFVEGIDPDWRVPSNAVFDLLIVAVTDPPGRVLELISGVTEQRPHLPVVVMQADATGSSSEFMQRVFDAGAEDIITLPEDPQRVLHMLRKAVARKRGSALGSDHGLGSLIAVIGPKGGTGKTVTTCNLAIVLAQLGKRVVVVDLDLSFGDVGLGLRLMPEKTIHDLARVGTSLDAEKVESYLVTHSSGVRALLAPVRPDQGGTITGEFLGRVFTILRETHDFVVVDTPAGFSAEVIAAVDNATDLCVVGMLDAFSLKDTRLGLETLALMSFRGRIHMVLNRADSHVGISHEDVIAILGRPPDVMIPSERMIPRSISEGVPFVISQKRSAATKGYVELAKRFLTESVPEHANGSVPPAEKPKKGAEAESAEKEPRRRLLRRS